MKSPCGKFKGSRLEFLPRWLVSGIIIGVISLAAGESKAAFTLPVWSNTLGWDDPSCYSTIQMADLDGDGQAELLGRCSSGIVAYAFSKDLGVWSPLPDGPSWTNSNGWDAASSYLTIQTGDLDGDGKAELLARGAEGMVAYSYSGGPAGTWSRLPDGPSWTNSNGWDAASSYLTIQTGDLDGDGKAELLARGVEGMVAYSYSGGPAGTWSRLPDGPSWTNSNGWDAASSYLTIQTGDLDGDGRVELLARGAEGMVAYSYSGGLAETWSRLLDGPSWTNSNGWDAASSYLTIQTGDLDGDGKAELLARGAEGLVAYSYNGWPVEMWSRLPDGPSWANSNGWDAAEYYATIHTGNAIGNDQAVLIGRGVRGIDTYKYTAGKWAPTVAPFPQFTGDELTAYNKIPEAWATPLAHPIRYFYSRYSQESLDDYADHLQKPKNRPKGVKKHAWRAVTRQIVKELRLAGWVAVNFSNIDTFLNNAFTNNAITLGSVATQLEIDQDSSDKITAVFSDMFSAVVDAIGIGTERAAAEIITKFLASAIDAGTELGMDGSLSEDYVKLAGDLQGNFQDAVNGNGNNQTTIATNYGLLVTLGQLFESGKWHFPKEGSSTYKPAFAAASKQYSVFLWRTLTPVAWQWRGFGCHGYTYNGTGLVLNAELECVPKEQLDLLFQPTPSNCLTKFDGSCSMGLSMKEVCNGWNIPDSAVCQ
ncbi:FG-GAP repeat domain-containing protein [Nitrospira sp. Ecomares 2.1]